MAQPGGMDAFLIQMAAAQQQIAEVLGHVAQNNAGGGSAGLKPKLPTYEGKRGVDNVRKFRAQIETACDATNTNVHRRVAIASSQLRGAAAEWWFTKVQQEGQEWARSLSPDQFFQLLEETFQPDNHSSYVYNQLEKLRQTKEIYDYINEFSNLANQLNGIVNDFILIRQFIKGLKPQTKYQVTANNPISLQETFKIATHYDQAFNAVNAELRNRNANNVQRHTYNRQHVPQRPQQQSGSTPMEIDQLGMRQRQFNGDMSKVLCYACKNYGHYAHSCPNKKKKMQVNDLEVCETEVQHTLEEEIDTDTDCDDQSGNDLLPFM